MRGKRYWLAASLVLVLVLTACSSGSQSGSSDKPADSGTTTAAPATTPAAPATSAPATAQSKSRLDIVLERGKLICGVHGGLPGFGYLGSDGKYSGFDVDYCRALAAALFNDPEKVEYKNLNASQRFTAVQTGEVDVLIRNTTWTVSRDTSVGMEFAPTTFYDGQGMMVRKDSGIKSLKDFEGRSVCVETGTTTELNLADVMRKLGVKYDSVVYTDAASAVSAYTDGRCDGYTTDKSGLVSYKSKMPVPDDHVILEETMSKEPLGPLTINNDSKWFDVVKWLVHVTIEAEEYGITSKNVDQLKAESKDPTIRRMLGVEGDLGKGMGLSNDWVYRVIKHVGNYGEIFDRNLGPGTPYNLPRGMNKLYKDGGILYAPPYR
ncbi:MAG: amino acid ABC transporter substrate-binding protein [Bacillota bacterium]